MRVAIRDLQFARGGRSILDIPELEFPAGTVTAVFGPNGSGKTSLLRALAGLERVDGSIVVGEQRVRRGDTRIAIAFQQPIFLRGTVRDNLEVALELRGVRGRERRQRLDTFAAACGTSEVLDRPAHELSAGEAQRVNLARTLCLSAPVTLLDEPLSGFDRIGRTRMLEELPELLAAHATTAVVVTHDREEAFRLADRLVILARGRVAASGDAGAIYRAPPDAECARLLGYTVIRSAGRLIGFPPGALQRGGGPSAFTLVVSRELDMGNHRHLIGRAGAAGDGAVAELRLAPGEPGAATGEHLTVHPSRWVEFPGSTPGA